MSDGLCQSRGTGSCSRWPRSTGNAKGIQLADNLLWLDWSGCSVALVAVLMHSIRII
jgi:hypothetical protein